MDDEYEYLNDHSEIVSHGRDQNSLPKEPLPAYQFTVSAGNARVTILAQDLFRQHTPPHTPERPPLISPFEIIDTRLHQAIYASLM